MSFQPVPLDPTTWDQFGIVETNEHTFVIIRCYWPQEHGSFTLAILTHPYQTFDEAVRVFREDIIPRRTTL